MAHFVNFLKSKGFVAGRHAYKPMLIFVLLYAFHSLSLSLPLFFLSQIKITDSQNARDCLAVVGAIVRHQPLCLLCQRW